LLPAGTSEPRNSQESLIGIRHADAVAGVSASGDAPSRERRVAAFVRIAILVFAGYYIGARVGLSLTFMPNPISVLWPPNAIVFTALLLVPIERWWIVVAAALPAHLLAELQGGVPALMVLCWFVSNVAEAMIGAALTRWLVRGALTFDTLLNVAAFLSAAILAVFLSSFLDSAFVSLNGWGQRGYWEVWGTRFFSNVTAALFLIPLVVTSREGGMRSLRVATAARKLELAVLAVALLAAAVAVFDSEAMTGASPALLYLPLPLLLWAALRFGPAGASASFSTVAILVIWGAGHGLGPFGVATGALAVQLFLIFIGPTLLCLAAALEERRHAEAALKLDERRFQLVLEATKDAVYDREMTSGALWWSGNGLMQFGYGRTHRPRDFRSWAALIHPEDRDAALRCIAIAAESDEQRWEWEFRLRTADGSYAHVHEHGFIMRDAGGAPVQMIGAITDISQRRDLEELNQRLSHASRLAAMGELTASIAHEINQPMSAILSNVDAAEMLLDDSGRVDRDERDAELRQVLRDIRNDDLRASEVIRHIRNLANKRETERETFRISGLVEAVLRLVAPIAQRRNVEVSAEFMQVPLVHGDRIHVQQVLLNLLFNAMDAMASTPEAGRVVRLSTSRTPSGFVLTSVRDSGHGIAAEHLDDIFDSFFTTKKEGMGLGLSIARSLVEANGGKIWAENNADCGATFRFTLPAKREATAATPGADTRR
jgi:two-component system, LuxR family, sensor kinase FixL